MPEEVTAVAQVQTEPTASPAAPVEAPAPAAEAVAPVATQSEPTEAELEAQLYGDSTPQQLEAELQREPRTVTADPKEAVFENALIAAPAGEEPPVAPVEPKAPEAPDEDEHPNGRRVRIKDSLDLAFIALRKAGVPANEAADRVYGTQAQAEPSVEPAAAPDAIAPLKAKLAEVDAKLAKIAKGEDYESDPAVLQGQRDEIRDAIVEERATGRIRSELNSDAQAYEAQARINSAQLASKERAISLLPDLYTKDTDLNRTAAEIYLAAKNPAHPDHSITQALDAPEQFGLKAANALAQQRAKENGTSMAAEFGKIMAQTAPAAPAAILPSPNAAKPVAKREVTSPATAGTRTPDRPATERELVLAANTEEAAQALLYGDNKARLGVDFIMT